MSGSRVRGCLGAVLGVIALGSACWCEPPPANDPPPGWTCSDDDWTTPGVCDCGCAVADPVCAGRASCDVVHCEAGERLDEENWAGCLPDGDPPPDAGPPDAGVEPADDAGPSDAGTDAGPEGPCGATPCTWTVLVYMAADNNLEAAAIDDLTEMMAVAPSVDVNVIVQVDRASGFYELGIGQVAAWESMKRFEVRGDDLVEVADLGEQNTGSPDVLSDFVTWGIDAYPADRTLLVLWNHGNAWQGYGGDDEAGHDRLTQSEVAQGISDGITGAGATGVTVVGFDACLMSSLDTAAMMRPFTRWFIASEEVEPSHGWDYTALLDFLTSDTDVDPELLGAEIVESYWQQARDANKHRYVTINLLDLDKLNVVDSALAALLGGLSLSVEADKTEVAAARTDATKYGRHPDPLHDYHMADLGHFASALSARVPALADEQVTLQAALDDVVVAARYGDTKQGSSGLSVYFPPEEVYYLSDYDEEARAIEWRDFLRTFYGLAGGAIGAPDVIDQIGDGDELPGAARASASCDVVSGPSANGQLGSDEASRVASAFALGGLVDIRRGGVEVFSRKEASFDAATGALRADWDRRVLVANQGARQVILFSEHEKVLDAARYMLVTVPLTYSEPVACACAVVGTPGYSDVDLDGIPDCADGDVDEDGVDDKGTTPPDNCPWIPNSGQGDVDSDGTGDACESGTGAPSLSCVPEPAGAFGVQETAFWLVTIDLLHDTPVDASLFVAGQSGVAELTPTPGALVWPRSLRLDESGASSWQTLRPLPFNLHQPIELRYVDVEQLYVLNEAGASLLDADGLPQSALPGLGFGSPFVAVEVADFAGNAEAAGVVHAFSGCEATDPPLCPPGQLPDCDGTCVDSGRLFRDDRCDDGSFGPDFYCALYGWDFGDCTAPLCPAGLDLIPDCDGACTMPSSSLGDGSCNAALNCPQLGYDADDCPCGDGCSGNGACVADECVCAGGYTGQYCEIPPTCGDGTCTLSEGERCSTCPSDCGSCAASCGDGTCQQASGESCESCASDCGACSCGDDYCSSDESCTSCSADCGGCPICGDFVCELWTTGAPFTPAQGDSCGTCPSDCGACQGDCCVTSEATGQQYVAGGCGDADVAACVCGAQPECCVQGWSESCLTIAVASCGLVCEDCPAALGSDVDDDGRCGNVDNCRFISNDGQEDGDGDGVGDACDNCPVTYGPSQRDSNADGVGDVCSTPAASCGDHILAGRTRSGVYTVDRGGGPVQVYCDQDTDGGGWMLMTRFTAPGAIDLMPDAVYDASFRTSLWIEGAAAGAATSPSAIYDGYRVDSVDWREHLVDGERFQLRQTFFKDAGAEKLDVAYRFRPTGFVAQSDGDLPDQGYWSLSDRAVYDDTTGIAWDVNPFEIIRFWLPVREGNTGQFFSGCGGWDFETRLCSVDTDPQGRLWGSAGLSGNFTDNADPAGGMAPHMRGTATSDLVFVHQAQAQYGTSGDAMTLLYWTRPMCEAFLVGPDQDGDGYSDVCDNCPELANADQLNTDGDALGDVCDSCPLDVQFLPGGDGGEGGEGGEGGKQGFPDEDGDGLGDACDPCLGDPINDPDGDGLCVDVDNCPLQYNASQTDSDGDGVGDVCLPRVSEAHWSFEADACPTIDDDSGNGYGGTCIGTGPTFVPDGAFGDSAEFDGSSQVTVGAPLSAFRGDFTVTFWARTAADFTTTLFGATAGGLPGLAIDSDASGGLAVTYRPSPAATGGVGFVSFSNVVGQDIHVALVRSATQDYLELYIDGVYEGGGSPGALADAIDLDVVLGSLGPNGEGTEMVGSLDEVQVWAEALSYAKIYALSQGLLLPGGDPSSVVEEPPPDGGVLDGGEGAP